MSLLERETTWAQVKCVKKDFGSSYLLLVISKVGAVFTFVMFKNAWVS